VDASQRRDLDLAHTVGLGDGLERDHPPVPMRTPPPPPPPPPLRMLPLEPATLRVGITTWAPSFNPPVTSVYWSPATPTSIGVEVDLGVLVEGELRGVGFGERNHDLESADVADDNEGARRGAAWQRSLRTRGLGRGAGAGHGRLADDAVDAVDHPIDGGSERGRVEVLLGRLHGRLRASELGLRRKDLVWLALGLCVEVVLRACHRRGSLVDAALSAG